MRIRHRLLWFLKPLGFLTQVVLGVGIACVCSLLIISQSSSPKAPASSLSSETLIASSVPSKQEDADVILFGMPARLKIPKIGVDAAIEKLGVTPDGSMQSPAKAKDAGWYKFGPKPGNVGSAVIAGHFGSGIYSGKSVFDNLHTLSEGDNISVEDEAGAIAIFRVRESRVYAKDEVVPRVFTSSDGKVYLNLVTCQGKWKADDQTYENRLVVFADKTDN